MTFPGAGPYVVVGRTDSYAWSATAGTSDLVDARVELLCEPDARPPTPDSTHYAFDGRCVPMDVVSPDPKVSLRTRHGPVVERGTVGGRPVAVSLERSSRGWEGFASLSLRPLNLGQVGGAEDFAPTMRHVPFSVNWFFLDSRDIAFFHSGRYPVRAPGIDPDLPTWGTGEWEWRGTMDWTALPRDLNPPQGYLASWNNKVAPGWATGDGVWGVGAVQRVDLLTRRMEARIAAGGGLALADAVTVVQDAASADLRGEAVVPEMLAVLDGSPAPSPELERARAALSAWAATGAHRRDRDSDLFYDEPAVVLMDVLFRPLAAAVYPNLADLFAALTLGLDNAPSSYGASFDSGWYALVFRELRRIRGLDAGPLRAPVACGGGDLGRCRAALWDALGAAYAAARDTQAFPWLDIMQWRKWAAPERPRFIPYVFNTETMRWTNRATFQQALTFGD